MNKRGQLNSIRAWGVDAVRIVFILAAIPLIALDSRDETL
jgi:hypothetical protein